MAQPRGGSSLPTCPLCTESLGTYGGPATLPCGHNLCLHCAAYLQQRQAQCPLCRAPFPPDQPLMVNCELRELMRMAEALTAVEREDEWQAVTSAAKVDMVSCKDDAGASVARLRRGVSVSDVLEGSGSAMDLDPRPWEPDSSSAACRGLGCAKPFSFLLRPRHHCRCCGQLFCGACTAERMLLPPKFQQAEPQRVCAACRELLLPIQPLLAGSIAPAVRPPVQDVTDWSAPRSLLNPPLSSRLETDVYTATNILRSYIRTVGSLPRERAIPPAILRGCTGLAILSVARAGAGWSLSVGSGLVVARTAEGGWSAPSAVLSLASSVGWQLGVEVQDLVLVLRSHAALKAFCSSQLGVGGSLSVAAGPVGRAAAARALGTLGGGSVAYSYSATRGMYAGVVVEGTVLRPRDAVNQQFYGRRVSARQLLISGAVPPPPAAAALYSALDALMEHGGEATGPQFLSQSSRAASEPGLHAVTAAQQQQQYERHDHHSLLPAAVSASASAPLLPADSDDDWEPEPPPAAAAAGHARGRSPGTAPPMPPAFASLYQDNGEEELPQAWGHLFD